MPASFSSLPLELVKNIVAVVHEQDRAFEALRPPSEVTVAARVPAPPDWLDEDELETYWDDDGTDPAKGLWSYWYGRGISALSMVNKQLYELASPLLHEEVIVEQVTKPFFKLGVLGQPLARHIRWLHVASLLGSRDFAELDVDFGTALRNLPNLDGLAIEAMELVRFTVGGVRSSQIRDEAIALVDRALSATFMRLAKLTLARPSDDILKSILAAVNPHALRELHIQGNSLAAPLSVFDDDIAAGLNSLVRLETLELHCHAVDLAHLWGSVLHFPSLQTLRLGGYRHIESSLSFAHDVAPRLVKLEISLVRFGGELAQPLTLAGLLPTLRYLSVEVVASVLEALRCLDGRSLAHIHFCTRHEIEFTNSTALKTIVELPYVPRLITATLNGPNPLDVPQFFIDDLTAHGVCFRAFREPTLEDHFAAGLTPPDSVPDGIEPEQLAVAEELVQFAVDRLAWLKATDDAAGVHELVKALQRVRERQIIEQT